MLFDDWFAKLATRYAGQEDGLSVLRRWKPVFLDAFDAGAESEARGDEDYVTIGQLKYWLIDKPEIAQYLDDCIARYKYQQKS